MNELKIGISGKRLIAEEERAELAKEVEKQIRAILKRKNASGFIGYSPLAIGADSVFAEVVTQVFKMPLQVVLPFSQVEYEKDFSPGDKNVLNAWIQKYGVHEVVTDKVPADLPERKDAYFNVGKWLVDHCDEMIFLWDGLKPSGKGGTAEIVGYCGEMKNKPLVTYIPVKPEKADPVSVLINERYVKADAEAIHHRDKYRRVWRLAIFLGWLALANFAINTAFNDSLGEHFHFFLVCAEFLLVLAVFILIKIAKSRNYHGKYLKQRLRAEIFRILDLFHRTNTELRISDFTLENDSEMAEAVQVVNDAARQSDYSSKWYNNYAIKAFLDEQIEYHSGKIKQIGNKFSVLEQAKVIIAICFMVNLITHLANAAGHYFHGINLQLYGDSVSILLNILLPGTYAAVEGILYFQEWATLKKYSVSARQSLEETWQELPDLKKSMDDKEAIEEQGVAINLVSSIMLSDNRNWHLILENKNNYHYVV